MFPRFSLLFWVLFCILIPSVLAKPADHVIRKRQLGATFAVGCAAFTGIRHCSNIFDDCPPHVCDVVEAPCSLSKMAIPFEEICKPEVKAAIEKFIRVEIFSKVDAGAEEVKHAMENLGEQISNDLEQFAKSVQDFGENVGKTLNEFGKDTAEKTEEFWKDVGHKIKDFFDNLGNTIAKGFSYVKNIFV